MKNRTTLEKILTICLAGFCAISGILTLVTYILYEFFSIGFEYLPMLFFLCAMFGGAIMMLIGFSWVLMAGRYDDTFRR